MSLMGWIAAILIALVFTVHFITYALAYVLSSKSKKKRTAHHRSDLSEIARFMGGDREF